MHASCDIKKAYKALSPWVTLTHKNTRAQRRRGKSKLHYCLIVIAVHHDDLLWPRQWLEAELLQQGRQAGSPLKPFEVPAEGVAGKQLLFVVHGEGGSVMLHDHHETAGRTGQAQSESEFGSGVFHRTDNVLLTRLSDAIRKHVCSLCARVWRTFFSGPKKQPLR